MGLHEGSSRLEEVIELPSGCFIWSFGLVSHLSGHIEDQLNGLFVRQTFSQRQLFLGLIEDLEQLSLSIVPSALDSILVVGDLLVDLLEIAVVEFISEKLKGMLVVCAQFVVSVELVGHSSFLNSY